MTTSKTPSRRITQRRIAELAGVSQATVSLVLNDKADGAARIPEETRDRVLKVLRETGYVADPAARRLAGVGNKIIGVFTYEPAFPTESLDFYTPLLSGIEAEAEELGCDLLIFTSAPVVDGTRQLFHQHNRLRLADGVLLLGREMDADELATLVRDGYRVVAVGRRDAPDIPYVGIDYASATESLLRRALELGHRRVMFLTDARGGESGADRLRGYEAALEGASVESTIRPTDGALIAADWLAVRQFGPTLVVVESPTVGAALRDQAIVDGIDVPTALSMIVLGSPSRASEHDVDFTRLAPPRAELGALAVGLLSRILSDDDEPAESELRTLIDCAIVEGNTLVAPEVRA